jgi:hypothetical protein
LKESKYYHPEVTEVIFDSNLMLAIATDSISLVQDGYDMLWDTVMCRFIYNHHIDGIKLVEQHAKEKGIKLRLIVEITKDNRDFINSLKYLEIRHLDGIRSNIGIFDERAYMVAIFHKENIQPDQILFSNAKSLVKQQVYLFDNLWNMAIPLSIKSKDMEYEDKVKSKRMITNYEEINKEIKSLIELTKKELILFSSINIIHKTFHKHKLLNSFLELLNRNVLIKILVDDVDNSLINNIDAINRSNRKNSIHLGYSSKLGNFNEMIIIVDSRYLLRIGCNLQNNMEAAFSNEEHIIQVQEILFEKYWNEVNGLKVMEC